MRRPERVANASSASRALGVS